MNDYEKALVDAAELFTKEAHRFAKNDYEKALVDAAELFTKEAHRFAKDWARAIAERDKARAERDTARAECQELTEKLNCACRDRDRYRAERDYKEACMRRDAAHATIREALDERDAALESLTELGRRMGDVYAEAFRIYQHILDGTPIKSLGPLLAACARAEGRGS